MYAYAYFNFLFLLMTIRVCQYDNIPGMIKKCI